MFLSARNCRMFSATITLFFDMPKFLVIISLTPFFYAQLACDHSNSQRTITTYCLTYLTLTSILHVESFPLQETFFTFMRPTLNLMCLSKTRVRRMLLSPYTCKEFQELVKKFSPNEQKIFRFIDSSLLIADRS